jgi:hypothetical protein
MFSPVQRLFSWVICDALKAGGRATKGGKQTTPTLMRVGGRCCIVPCATPSGVPSSYVLRRSTLRRQTLVSRRARAVPAHAAAGEVDVMTTAQESLPLLAYTLRGIYATELTARPVRTAAFTACVLYGISDAFAQVCTA